ncbi:MAG: 30S ribosomal protein S20 [Bacteroidetes bacterium]|nr:MAG: 30S ribosomal protein S20 [Bacteroidota bacterium]
MQRHKSAQKQARKAVKNRERNRRNASILSTAVKRVREEKNKEKAEVALNAAYKTLDRLSDKGIIHKNNAARQKSQLKKLVSALQPSA